MIAGSSDGLYKDCIIEIKGHTSEKAGKRYIKNAILAHKWKAQVQLQM